MSDTSLPSLICPADLSTVRARSLTLSRLAVHLRQSRSRPSSSSPVITQCLSCRLKTFSRFAVMVLHKRSYTRQFFFFRHMSKGHNERKCAFNHKVGQWRLIKPLQSHGDGSAGTPQGWVRTPGCLDLEVFFSPRHYKAKRAILSRHIYRQTDRPKKRQDKKTKSKKAKEQETRTQLGHFTRCHTYCI